MLTPFERKEQKTGTANDQRNRRWLWNSNYDDGIRISCITLRFTIQKRADHKRNDHDHPSGVWLLEQPFDAASQCIPAPSGSDPVTNSGFHMFVV
jgi:hypothetical protein